MSTRQIVDSASRERLGVLEGKDPSLYRVGLIKFSRSPTRAMGAKWWLQGSQNPILARGRMNSRGCQEASLDSACRKGEGGAETKQMFAEER